MKTIFKTSFLTAFTFIVLSVVLFGFPQTSLAKITYCCQDPAKLTGDYQCLLIGGGSSPANRCAENETCDTKTGKCIAPTGSVDEVFGKIVPPDPVRRIGFGNEGISKLLTNAILLIYILSGVIFVFMIIISGLQWILSGGDKEAVAGARRRLIYAILGMAVLALAFFIAQVVAQITGITLPLAPPK